jgi:hypothetical protein
MPWTFSLQVANADVPGANWTTVATGTSVFMLTDPGRRFCGKGQSVFYRVVLTAADGSTYISQIAGTFGNLNTHLAAIVQELQRKETLRLQGLGVGIPGIFLKMMNSGTPCPLCLDPYTGESTDGNCPDCYGSKWNGGYYAPLPMIFGDVNQEMQYIHRDINSGEQMVNERVTTGYFIATPYMAHRDIWVNANSGVFYQIHELKIRTHVQGVPVLTDVGLRFIPFSDHVYTIPLS